MASLHLGELTAHQTCSPHMADMALRPCQSIPKFVCQGQDHDHGSSTFYLELDMKGEEALQAYLVAQLPTSVPRYPVGRSQG